MNNKLDIIGYLTHFSPDQARGFVMDVNRTDSLQISLYCNGDLVTEQVADLPNEMLTARELPSEHGFYFDLRSLGAFHFRDQIEVRVGDVALPMAPHLALAQFRQGWRKSIDKTLFFFMHIPKTAGTSFRMLLNRQFQQDEIWPNKEDLASNDRRYPSVDVLRALDKKRKASAQLMLGHYPLWTLRFMDVRPEVITFVRQPLQHINSLLHHKKTRSPELSNKSQRDILLHDIIDNPQTHFFLPAHIVPGQITSSEFEVAARNMETCAFVGLQDRFDDGLDYLERCYGWSFGKRIRKNVGEPPMLPEELKEIIDEKTMWDRKLYNLAKMKFDKLLNNK